MWKKILIISGVLLLLAGVLFVAYATGIFISRTTTDSMDPTYRVGKTWSIVNPFDRHPDVGDVVVYKCYAREKCPKTYTWNISHRLVGRGPDGCYLFAGDNPKYDWSREPCLLRGEFVLLGTDHILFEKE